jgi:hypothetical protein
MHVVVPAIQNLPMVIGKKVGKSTVGDNVKIVTINTMKIVTRIVCG